MESLNSYISDGESDSSPCNSVVKKSLPCSDEVDANCEPITMDMSEDSCSGRSDENDAKSKKVETKRQYSKSLSPSPPTSFSSRDSSPRSKKHSGEIRSSSERSKRDSSKDRRRDEEKRRDDRERSRKRDDDRYKSSRRDRSRDRNRDRDSDRRSKRYDSRKSNRSRSRSSSYSKHRSSKRKHRSRSRSRSYDRHHRKRSPREDRHRRRSPYRSRRSRSKSKSKEKSKPYEWKPSAKLKVLEKLGIELKIPATGIDVPQGGNVALACENNSQLTPQLLLQKSMEEHVEKVKSATGIQLPSYYNPMAVNPTKYAEQIQKRRLLWGNKGKETQQTTTTNEQNGSAAAAAAATESKSSGTIWKGATFGGDQDGKMTAKFQRLMGMKNAGPAPAINEPKVSGTDLIKKQEEMFHSMESQYEVARLATHSHRGLGLGFGTFQPR